MGMQIHHLGIHELFGLKLVINSIDDFGGHGTAGISQGQIDCRHYRKTTAGVGQNRKSDIRKAFHNAVINLSGLGQGLAGIIFHHNFSIGAFFHFLAPGFSQFALDMAGWEKIAVGQFYRAGIRIECAD